MNGYSNEDWKSQWQIEKGNINSDLMANVMRTSGIRNLTDFGLERGSGTYNAIQFDFYLSVVESTQLQIPCFNENNRPIFEIQVTNG